MNFSLQSLPVDLVYRILDNLDDKAIFLSILNVSERLNRIIDTYHRYQVTIVYHHSRYRLNINIDTYNTQPFQEQNRCKGSAIFGTSIAKEHSKNILFFSIKNHYYVIMQTLTTLNLGRNQIKTQGAQYVAQLLEINTVKKSILLFHYVFIIVFQFRRSQRSILTKT